jgi:hypothetical protein
MCSVVVTPHSRRSVTEKDTRIAQCNESQACMHAYLNRIIEQGRDHVLTAGGARLGGGEMLASFSASVSLEQS